MELRENPEQRAERHALNGPLVDAFNQLKEQVPAQACPPSCACGGRGIDPESEHPTRKEV